jgi:hypothetical protein
MRPSKFTSTKVSAGILLFLATAVALGLAQLWISARAMKRSIDLEQASKEIRLLLDTWYVENGEYPGELTNLVLPPEVGVYDPAKGGVIPPCGGLLKYSKASSNEAVISANFEATILLGSSSRVWRFQFGQEAKEEMGAMGSDLSN